MRKRFPAHLMTGRPGNIFAWLQRLLRPNWRFSAEQPNCKMPNSKISFTLDEKVENQIRILMKKLQKSQFKNCKNWQIQRQKNKLKQLKNKWLRRSNCKVNLPASF